MTRETPFDDVSDLFGRLGSELDEVGTALESRVRSDVPVDVVEREDAFVVRADLPGFDAEDVDLAVSGRLLTLRADAESSTETGEGTDGERYHRRERRTRSVARRIRLPGDVVETEATASYEDGVVTVTLPKREPSEEGTRIDVE